MAQSDDGTVRQIVIEGAQRIEEGTVRSYLLLQEGDPFDARRIDQSLKSLFATGLFADVSLTRRGDALVINVVENPVINRIAFEGNLRISDELLQGEVSLRPRVVFTRTKVQNDVKRILDVYRVNGRFAATVSPKVIRLDQNRADLVFEIDEGPVTKVESIRFVGNRVMSDSKLREIIRTKETAFYRFLSDADTYDPDRLTFDRELLRRFYLEGGYADFRVDSAIAELTLDRSAFLVTISVDEGPRYKFGNLDVAIGLRGLEASDLKEVLEFKSGDWYDSSNVDNAVEQISGKVGDLGFAFVEVRPRVTRNREAKTIDITFDVAEGPRVFIERIEIAGNVRTIDKVIRREFRLVEGDAFNASKLQRSRQRIRDLDYFSKVEVQNVAGSAQDKTVVKVDVEEKSTGSLNLGIGFATDAGPLVDVSLRERNLLGRGQTIALNTSIAAERSQVNLAFTEPFFLDREVAAGFDIFHIQTDLQDTRSFDSRRTGGGLRVGYPLSTKLRQNLRYSFEFSEIENVAASASTLIRAQEGERYLSQVGHILTYDTRNSRINPTEGFIARLNNDLAGIGGTVRFLRNEVGAEQFYPITDEFILSVSGEVGHIFGLGEDVEIADRFFLGGDSLRGFQTAGVGPRDRVTKDSLGGEWRYNGTVQMKMPVGLPKEFGLSSRVFSDFGSAGSVNPSNANTFDSGSIRASVGAGVGWESPFGPINVDFGFPVLKEDLDETELVRINFGTRF